MAEIPAAQLLRDHLHLLTSQDLSGPVLDLACGRGRNGLVLAVKGVEVVFADNSANALKVVETNLLSSNLPGSIWQIDLEQGVVNPLSGRSFGAIMGFHYLHRPLFSAIKAAVMPGGLVVYETFTTDNRCFGRPRNPAFLLRPGELEIIFQDWIILHVFEGVHQNPQRAIAQIVARKPEDHPVNPNIT